MGSFNEEVCELVGLYRLAKIFGKENVGLYWDDGLVVIKSTTDLRNFGATKSAQGISAQVRIGAEKK